MHVIRDIIGFKEGALQFRSLGVPFTANKLSKLECGLLVEKITKRITTWATKTTSYVGRAALINSILTGVFNFWQPFLYCLKG